MKDVITRTFTTVYASCVMFNEETRETYDASILVGSLPVMSTTVAEKAIRKSGTVGKLVMVDHLTKIEELYGMTESDFIKFGQPVTERGKATRNAITKTVNSYMGDYVYMDMNDRAVKSRPVSVPLAYAEKLDKFGKKVEQSGEKYITIENLRKVSALYAISESDFRAHGRIMIDHNHFKE